MGMPCLSCNPLNLPGLTLPEQPEPARLTREFYCRDVLAVAPELIGKTLVRNIHGQVIRCTIMEAEAYRGEEDLACHARNGKTLRNRIMYGPGGFVYVYLIYGLYWMLNVVAGGEDNPQAVLIRGIEGFSGPGKLTRALSIDKSFYGEDLVSSDRLWIESTGMNPVVLQSSRIGIDYAGEPWKSINWRYCFKSGIN
jgi:DNA-3-methyladenine glycosylase